MQDASGCSLLWMLLDALYETGLDWMLLCGIGLDAPWLLLIDKY